MRTIATILGAVLFALWPAPAVLAATWCDDYIEAWHYDANWDLIGYTFVHNHVVEWSWGSANGYYNRIESWTICYNGGGRRTQPGGEPMVEVASPVEGTYYAHENLVIEATATDPQYPIKRFDVRIDGVAVQPGQSVPLARLGNGAHVFAAAAFNSVGLHTLVAIPFTVEPSPLDEDTTPPTLSCTASPNELWPPRAQFVPIRIGVVMSDDMDPAPDWRIVGVSAKDLEGSTWERDILPRIALIGADGKSLWLCSWKSPLQRERVYAIELQGTDRSGNTARCSTTVTVARPRAE